MAKLLVLTHQHIDELLRFLPALEAPGRTWYVVSPRQPDTDYALPRSHAPLYAPDVLAFFRAAEQPWWCDYGYDPRRTQELLADDVAIAAADLKTIRSLLTLCVRGERFCDGWWGAILERGRVQAVLRRLAELRQELPAGPSAG